MPLEGRQLRIGDALALCYAKGFHGFTKLVTAVSVMSAESLRYVKAYHINDDLSTDRGLFQINDRAHPDLSDADAYHARPNVEYAHGMYVAQGFSPWAAYTSGRYFLFWPLVATVWGLGHWRTLVSRWES